MSLHTQKTAQYRLDLLENGLDFLKAGIETYFGRKNPAPRAHKYAILHVFSGMLLLLKERLVRIRPSLIFVPEADFGKPGAKTTGYHKTLARLQAEGIHISPKRRAVLNEIRNLRNQIEHYQVELPLARSKEVIAEMVSFVYTFSRDELNLHIDDRLSGRVRSQFYELKEVGDRIQRDLEESAQVDAEADEQYFREFEARYAAMSPEALLRHAAATEGLRIEDVPRHQCPDCDKYTFLYLEVGVCASPSCHATYQLKNCRSCLGVMINGSSSPFCDSCLQG